MVRRIAVACLAALLLAPAARASEPPTVANPASTNCARLGGVLTIETDGSGGQYGVCHFEDNRQCEEWALLRGECPTGGLRITGYATPAARYCALRGGHYLPLSGGNTSSEQGVCAFPSGKACAAGAYYDGLCAPDTAGDVVQATFRCADDRSIEVVFSNGARNSASLAPSDGRSLSLPQGPSGSGARYASDGDRVVFWNKGDTAFLEEDGRMTYRDCVAER
jgi:putative hemolysin